MSRSRGRMVVALSATTTAGYGVLFYAYGVLLLPMQEDLGWSRSYLSGVFSVALVVGAVLTIPVGRWLDRHPPRSLLLAGAFVSTALTAGWAAAHGRVQFLAVWVLLGACQALLFYEPAFTILAKWFDGHDRNRAITTVTLVAGLASTIFGPLTALLERSFGWRGAVLVLGGLLAAVTVPAFAWGLPRQVGDEGHAPSLLDALPREVFRTRAFWMLTLAYTFSAITTFGVAVHLVAFLRGRGVAAGTAATVLGAVGLVQVLGRSTFIRLSANRASVHLATWVLAAKAFGLALLVVVPGAPGVGLFVLIYGSANGMGTLTRATTIAELYGARHYGSISSVVASVTAVAGAIAPFAVAVAADLIGADAPVLAGLAALCVLAALANESVGRPTRGAALDVAEATAIPEP